MPVTTSELPHETAIRERRACADKRQWTPSAELIQRTARLASISAEQAQGVLNLVTTFTGGLKDATSFEARERLPMDLDRALLAYDAAVRASAVELKAAA